MLLRSTLFIVSLSVCSALNAQEASDAAKELRAIRSDLKALSNRLLELERKLANTDGEQIVVCDTVRVSFSDYSDKQEALNEIKRIGNLAYLTDRMHSRDGWEKAIPTFLEQVANKEWRYALENLPIGRISNVIETDDSYRLIVVRKR